MDVLRRHSAELQVLVEATPRARRALLAASGRPLMLTIAQQAYNIVRGTFAIPAANLRTLRGYSRAMRQLSAKRISSGRVRRVLTELARRRPFFDALLSPLVRALRSPPPE